MLSYTKSEFNDAGMKYYSFRGEKSYNGVAILSRIKIADSGFLNWCKKNDTRHISVKLKDEIEIHNFYVPAGGDEPADRAKRESVELSKRLGLLLASSKKKA